MKDKSLSPNEKGKRSADLSESESSSQMTPSPNKKKKTDGKEINTKSDIKQEPNESDELDSSSTNGISNDDINDLDENEIGDFNDSIQDHSSEETPDESSFNHTILSNILNEKKMVHT